MNVAVHGFFPNLGYTEGFRSYRIGLLAVLALCRFSLCRQMRGSNSKFKFYGIRTPPQSRKYWAFIFTGPLFDTSKSIDLNTGPLFRVSKSIDLTVRPLVQMSNFYLRVSSKHVKLLPYLLPSRFFETR
jgi:hypothetical protein